MVFGKDKLVEVAFEEKMHKNGWTVFRTLSSDIDGKPKCDVVASKNGVTVFACVEAISINTTSKDIGDEIANLRKISTQSSSKMGTLQSDIRSILVLFKKEETGNKWFYTNANESPSYINYRHEHTPLYELLEEVNRGGM